jgi:hypothetical protein
MKAGARPRPQIVPRRRKPSLAARARPFWIVAVLGAAFVTAGGAWLAQAPWFRVERVAIDVPLGSPVSREEVRAAAAVAPGANLWLLNPWAIGRRIEAIPYVERATLHREQFPQPFVELGITLRRPASCVRAGVQVVTLDRTARVLPAGCAAGAAMSIEAEDAALPAIGATVTDPDVSRLVADGKILSDADLSVRVMRRDRWGGLEAVDVTGVTLRFGEDDDLAKKAALVGPVRAGIGTKRALRAIDLRAPATPTVEFR